jgi:hypothetical protein
MSWYGSGMASYILINDDNVIDTHPIEAPDDLSALEKAINHLGYRLEPKTETNEMRDFYLIENSTGDEDSNFRGYLYQVSLIDALDRLGYSLYDLV